MNETKTQHRLSRQEAFQIMEWLKANREEMEFKTSKQVTEAIAEAGLRPIPYSVLIGMRKDLGWADRRVYKKKPDSQKMDELEKRIEAIEAFIAQFKS